MSASAFIDTQTLAEQLSTTTDVIYTATEFIPHIILPPYGRRVHRRYPVEYANIFIAAYQHQEPQHRPRIKVLFQWLRSHPNAIPYIYGFQNNFAALLTQEALNDLLSLEQLQSLLQIPKHMLNKWLYEEPLLGVVEDHDGTRLITPRGFYNACRFHLP